MTYTALPHVGCRSSCKTVVTRLSPVSRPSFAKGGRPSQSHTARKRQGPGKDTLLRPSYFFFFFSVEVRLIYNGVCEFLLHNQAIQLHVYILIHSFSHSFPLWFATGYWVTFAVSYSRTWLFVRPVYTHLRLLGPTSHSIPPLLLPLGNQEHTSFRP